MAVAEEEEASVGGGGDLWTPRGNSDLKISAIYNRNATEAAAEVNFATSSNTSVDEVNLFCLSCFCSIFFIFS